MAQAIESSLAPVSAANRSRAALPIPLKLLYGLGSVAFGIKDNGFSYLLLLFYNQVVGLSAPLVGLAIMLAMVCDACLDPIVGQVSDTWRSRLGRRHPFMYAAALPVALSYLALWNPPQGWSTGGLFAYLVVIAIIIRTFLTFYEVPSSALAAELTQGYDERTALMSYRYFFAWVGGLFLYLITFTFFLVPDATHKTGQTNPLGFARYGAVAASLMFVTILISALGTQRRALAFVPPPRERKSLWATLKEMAETWSNRSFLFLTLSGLMTSMAVGVSSSMNIYFNTFYWEFTSHQFSLLIAGVFASAFIALFAVAPLARRFGKRPLAVSLVIAAVSTGLAPILARAAGLMPPNHTAILFDIIFVQSIITVALNIAGATLITSMIADVVEDGELKTGRRSEGLYFSASSLVAKAVSGVGIFAASLILALIHFPAGARAGNVPEPILRHMALVYAPCQIALYAVGLLLLMGYTITRESHAETLATLAARRETLKEPGAAA
ncbi:MAG: MFS transporter [Alphaproteobacteria bacterium]|nr:MFS transporter [Alphaproteobacteria bacterium]